MFGMLVAAPAIFAQEYSSALRPSTVPAGFASPLTLSASAPSPAADAPANGKRQADADAGWHFKLGLPAWLPSVGGDLSVRGHELSGGKSGRELLNALAGNLDFAAVLRLEVEKGR